MGLIVKVRHYMLLGIFQMEQYIGREQLVMELQRQPLQLRKLLLLQEHIILELVMVHAGGHKVVRL